MECDFVVAGIGARADLNLFKGKLDLDQGGIKVDYHLRTSHPDVFAIGDIAAFPLSLENDILVRQEHVHHGSFFFVVCVLNYPPPQCDKSYMRRFKF